MRKFYKKINAKISQKNAKFFKVKEEKYFFEQLIVAPVKLTAFTKVCEMRPKIFEFFRETFRSVETLK